MEKHINQLIREYFCFLKKDRTGVIGLFLLITVLLAGHVVADKIELKRTYDLSEFAGFSEEQNREGAPAAVCKQLFEFDPNTITEKQLDSLDLSPVVARNLLRYRVAGGKFSSPSGLRKIYGMNDSIYRVIEPFITIQQEESGEKEKGSKSLSLTNRTFDPNEATVDELLYYGFNKFQAINLIRYLESGGRISVPEDLMKIYGIDSAFFKAIEGRVEIKVPHKERGAKRAVLLVQVELNTADSLQLVGLRGIGPVFATRILKFRELLGGFFTTRQLLEVYGFPRETFEALEESVCVDTLKIRKMRINFADYPELIRHPYVGQGLVKAILDYRSENGPFTSVHQLLEIGAVDSCDFVLLKPYFTCR